MRYPPQAAPSVFDAAIHVFWTLLVLVAVGVAGGALVGWLGVRVVSLLLGLVDAG